MLVGEEVQNTIKKMNTESNKMPTYVSSVNVSENVKKEDKDKDKYREEFNNKSDIDK